MMRTRHQHLTRGLACCLAGLGLITAIPTLLWQLRHSSSTVSFSATVSQAVGLVTLGSVGLLLTLRRPANSIGWIFVSVWAYAGGYGLLTAYASAWTLSDPTAADASLATWVVNWAWVPIIGVIAFYPLLLFPTGGPPSPRWRP
jgi:hypothetical protein